jgi:hypothetical protein
VAVALSPTRQDPHGLVRWIVGFFFVGAVLQSLPGLLITSPFVAVLSDNAAIALAASVTIGYLGTTGWFVGFKPTLKNRILWFISIDLALIVVAIILIALRYED